MYVGTPSVIDIDLWANFALSAGFIGWDDFFSPVALLGFEQRPQQACALSYEEKNHLLQLAYDHRRICDSHEKNDVVADDVVDAASASAFRFGTPQTGCLWGD
jgi:hypothetical protein